MNCKTNQYSQSEQACSLLWNVLGEKVINVERRLLTDKTFLHHAREALIRGPSKGCTPQGLTKDILSVGMVDLIGAQAALDHPFSRMEIAALLEIPLTVNQIREMRFNGCLLIPMAPFSLMTLPKKAIEHVSIANFQVYDAFMEEQGRLGWFVFNFKGTSSTPVLSAVETVYILLMYFFITGNFLDTLVQTTSTDSRRNTVVVGSGPKDIWTDSYSNISNYPPLHAFPLKE